MRTYIRWEQMETWRNFRGVHAPPHFANCEFRFERIVCASSFVIFAQNYSPKINFVLGREGCGHGTSNFPPNHFFRSKIMPFSRLRTHFYCLGSLPPENTLYMYEDVLASSPPCQNLITKLILIVCTRTTFA